MSLHRAVLVRHAHDDIPLVRDDVPLGEEYLVDTSVPPQRLCCYDHDLNREYTLYYVWVTSATERDFGLLPAVVLEIDEGPMEVKTL